MNFYVYRITDVRNKKYYYGSRQCKTDPIDDLGVRYFSSSLFVQRAIRYRPYDFRYKIVFECKSRNDAYRIERALHKKFDVANNPSFLNKAICGEIVPNRQKRKTKEEMRLINERVSMSHRAKMQSMSPEERSIKFGNKGITNPMVRYGGHSEETKKKCRSIQKEIANQRGSGYYKQMSNKAHSLESSSKREATKLKQNSITVSFTNGESKIFKDKNELGLFLNLSGQMGSRIIRHPHLMEKYSIISIEKTYDYQKN